MRQAVIVLFLLFLAADAAAGRVLVTVPAGINLSAERVRERLAGVATPVSGRFDTFEIVIYYYSLGIETFSYSDTHPLSESVKKGGIRALIKCRKSGVLGKALFVEAEGADESQILDNFARAVSRAIGRL
ncbi:MAG TPA: hypothetical protein PLA65_01750 [Spirochaetota bacterium]|nr:hypothetical protein [Spirochaetota bacterium]HOD14145.1 hypothetical protein [Spirochaetota bacterium]HPG49190.1 hypothetical protein [Spirochaetota bacterium]HPN10758.1 hypothetical protein [Spirochaetota bacterium]